VSGQPHCPAPEATPPLTPPSWRCDALEAPAHWQRIDFISDLHLHAGRPGTFAAWADYMARTPADAVLILGDLFELWVGDDMATQAFEQSAVKVLQQAGQRLWLGLMVGNRDFLMGQQLMQLCRATALDDPFALTAFGQRHLLTHGDAWCLDDAPYLKFRAMVRQPAWQTAFLQRSLPERLAVAQGIRTESEQRKSGQAMAEWADVCSAHAAQALQAHGSLSLIHGHTHRPASEPFAMPGAQRHVLPDWEFDELPDGQPPRGHVLRLSADGLQRLSLAQAVTGPVTEPR
jgi:UDP-2,3-diacylglucosamine hydrolase